MIEKLDRLYDLVRNKRKILVATHTNPDPDTIASAYAIRHLFSSWGLNSVLVYGGMIGRAENKAMINRLRIPLRSIQTVNPFNFKIIALIDAQPGAGNDPIPPSLLPSIVIDHHPARKRSLLKEVPFVDIRPGYGSTSTILAEYLQESGAEMTRRVATALYYGIKADTRDLGRDAHEIDVEMSSRLYPKVLLKTLSSIEYPRLPREYFRIIWKALDMTVWYPGKKVLVSELGFIMDPDMVPVMADFLIRVEGTKWVLVLGELDHEVIFSLRTTSHTQGSADRLSRIMIKAIEGGSAGGHDAMAAGKVALPPAVRGQEMQEKLKDRFLRKLGCEVPKGVPFL